jgi:flagellar hook-length control protein FliK
MELTAALPAELVALADPAPLPAPRGAGPPRQAPFALVLGLLAEAAPGGELPPAAGNELPFAAADGSPAAVALAATELLAAAAVLPRTAVPAATALEPAQAAAEASAPAARPPPPTALAARPPPSAAPPVATFVPHALGQAPAGGTEAPPAASAVPLASAAPAADTPSIEFALRRFTGQADGDEPQGLDAALLNDARFRAPPAPPLGLPPAPGSQWPSAAHEAHAPLAPAPPPPAELGAVRIGRPAAAAPLAPGDGAASSAPLDWLPPASAHGATGTAGAAAAPAPAAPGAPVDARAPDWHEAFAQRLQWIVDTQAGEAEIRLNPPELGAVNVKISLVDDKTHVHLVAATAAARDELAHALPRLRELFAAGGLELGSATVLDAHGEHFGRGGEARDGGGAALARALPLDELVDEPAAPGGRLARGRIDVFA